MLILGIILMVIGFLIPILGCIMIYKTSDPNYLVSFLFLILAAFGAIILTDCKNPIPYEKDVLEGKAIYQETIHITSNDTIKTYKIVWKE